jgi:hypothetical protein
MDCGSRAPLIWKSPVNLLSIIESTILNAEQVAARTAQIHAAALRKSRYLGAPNFNVIHPDDLRMLFAEYDRLFFDGQVTEALGDMPLSFGLSKRMTSAGGQTTVLTDRRTRARQFRISAATAILFDCFRDDDHRPIVASGLVCRDRLEALQRVMEHEITHLVELLLWDKSSCQQIRFHSITRCFFGHTENKHQLITPRERALVKFGIRPGSLVRFRFDGVVHTGIVNRVNKRATVLVEDEQGARYKNGKHYAKFYIPVQSLEAVQ